MKNIDFIGIERVENGYLIRVTAKNEGVLHIAKGEEELLALIQNLISRLRKPLPLAPAPEPTKEFVEDPDML